MTRPFDIPEWAQDAAKEAVAGWMAPGEHEVNAALITSVASALMAAQAEATEAAAKVAVDYLAEVLHANQDGLIVLQTAGLQTNESMRREELLATMQAELPDAIRASLPPAQRKP